MDFVNWNSQKKKLIFDHEGDKIFSRNRNSSLIGCHWFRQIFLNLTPADPMMTSSVSLCWWPFWTLTGPKTFINRKKSALGAPLSACSCYFAKQLKSEPKILHDKKNFLQDSTKLSVIMYNKTVELPIQILVFYFRFIEVQFRFELGIMTSIIIMYRNVYEIVNCRTWVIFGSSLILTYQDQNMVQTWVSLS